MTDEEKPRPAVGDVVRRLRRSWAPLLLTDLGFKAASFIVLTPLVGVLFRMVLAATGDEVVSDADILHALLSPLGLAGAIGVGALLLGVVALEQAALMAVLVQREQGQNLPPISAFRFAAANAWRVVRVTGRICAVALAAVLPCLMAAGLVYWALLTEYDINYYLKEQPTEWTVALALGAVIATALAAVILRLITSWFFALPVVLLEGVEPGRALRASAERAAGHRWTIAAWVVGWLLATLLLSAVVTGAVGVFGRAITPTETDSLRALTIAVGVTLLAWSVANLVVNVVNTAAFAAILLSLYRTIGGNGEPATPLVGLPTSAPSADRLRVTRFRLLSAGVIGGIIAITIGAATLGGVRLQDDVQIMAHRGASVSAPENTMAAFQAAIDAGADWIELDVQENADGEVVVMHDSDFMKLARDRRKIWNAKGADLADIDIGSWFSPDFADQRVPTLGEVLDLCKGKVGVNIELKYYGHNERLEQRVADAVADRGMDAQVMAMSLKREGVRKMKSLRPDWKVGLLMSVAAGDPGKIDADFLAVNAGFADLRLIEAAHASGKEVFVWTVNDAATMSAMISRGVDGLLTDDPALARSVLAQRAGLDAPQRLLLELAGLLGVKPELGEQ